MRRLGVSRDSANSTVYCTRPAIRISATPSIYILDILPLGPHPSQIEDGPHPDGKGIFIHSIITGGPLVDRYWLLLEHNVSKVQLPRNRFADPRLNPCALEPCSLILDCGLGFERGARGYSRAVTQAHSLRPSLTQHKSFNALEGRLFPLHHLSSGWGLCRQQQSSSASSAPSAASSIIFLVIRCRFFSLGPLLTLASP